MRMDGIISMSFGLIVGFCACGVIINDSSINRLVCVLIVSIIGMVAWFYKLKIEYDEREKFIRENIAKYEKVKIQIHDRYTRFNCNSFI